ncbi:MAG TPA: LuxR C-terminal-related transcriptional regulator [Natronosporangium sp.]
MATDVAARGAAALRAGDWEAARSAFERAVAEAEPPEALDGLARALWWLTDVEGAVSYRARAFTGYRRRGDRVTAARIAWWLVREYATVLQNRPAANGWLARARRLTEPEPTAATRGWLALAEAELAPDPADHRRHAEAAYTLAREAGDPDLEIYALGHRGLALITAGQVVAGITDLDEAMAAAGEANAPETIGDTLCRLMTAAELVGDPDRFSRWNRALEVFMAEHRHVPLYGFCFTCCGEVAAGAGQWEEAEGFYTRAVRQLAQAGHGARCAHPVTRLALLRIRQGRFAEAEGLLSAYRDLPEAVEPLAALLLARGQAAAASRLLQRRLARLGHHTLPAAPLLSMLARARAASADLDGARDAAGQLAELAERSGLDWVRGLAALAAGRVAAAQPRTDDADQHFDRAIAAFEAANRPLERAVARRELARLWAQRRPDLAAEEARAAYQEFERLGARLEADETAALLRSLGVRGRTGPKRLGQLSQREREVLELVAEGLTNAEIAARLFISTRTAGNHVSNLLMKLGARSRTEAAAMVLRDPARSGSGTGISPHAPRR